MLDRSKIFCEIIADDIADPLNNNYHAEDNVQNERTGKWNKQVLTYGIMKPTSDVERAKELETATNLFMTMWDIESNLTLIPSFMHGTVEPDIRIYFKTSEEEPYFKERPSVLAFAYYPEQGNASGIIVFNDDYWWNMTGEEVDAWKADPVNYTPGDGKKIKGYNYLAVGGHEFGHTLGLTHSVLLNSDDLMRPYYDPKVIWISLNDIFRMLLKYPEEAKGTWYNSRMRAWIRRRMLRYQLKKTNPR